MSKRHQVNRRRAYGRRQHELRERVDRTIGVLGAIDELEELHERASAAADVAVRELGLRAYGAAFLGAE
jgi:hypothetical protein